VPVLRNKRTGRDENVPDQLIEQAAASGDYDIPDDVRVTLTTPAGRVVSASPADVALAEGTLETRAATPGEAGAAERAAYIEQEFSGPGDTAAAFLGQAANAATFGGFDALVGSARGADYGDTRRAQVEANPVASVAGTITGSVLPALASGGAGAVGAAARLTPAGAASRLGANIAGSGGGLGRTVAGFGTEGVLTGLGQGAAELALAKDPLTVERAASVLSTNALLGGALGGGIGVVAKAAEKGIIRATGLVREAGATWRAQQGVASDLAGLDATSLRAAEEAELATIGASRTAAKEAVANDVVAYHQDARAAKPWLATKGDDEFKELGKVALKADKRVQSLLDNPHALAENPRPARIALQQQQHALEQIVAARPRIEAKISEEAAQATQAASPAAAVESFTPKTFPAKTPPVGGSITMEEFLALPRDHPIKVNTRTRADERVAHQFQWLSDNMSPALSEEQAVAVRLYQGSGHETLNGWLRGNPAEIEHALKAEDGFLDMAEYVTGRRMGAEEAIGHLDRAIESSVTPEDLLLYRGTKHLSVGGEKLDWIDEAARLSPEDRIDKGYLRPPQVGDVLDAEPGFLSTALDAEAAADFGTFVVEVRLPKNSKALFVNQMADEEAKHVLGTDLGKMETELLLPRGTAFRIREVRYDVPTPEGPKTMLTVDPVPPGGTGSNPAKNAPVSSVEEALAVVAKGNGADVAELRARLPGLEADEFDEQVMDLVASGAMTLAGKHPRGANVAGALDAGDALYTRVVPRLAPDSDRFRAIPAVEIDDFMSSVPVVATERARQAANMYTGDNYGEIAGFLRGRKPGPSEPPDAYSASKVVQRSPRWPGDAPGEGMANAEAVRELDGVTASGRVPRDTILYRGMAGDHLPTFRTGEVFTDPSFQSTSPDIARAEFFTVTSGTSNRTLMEIEAPAGTPVGNVSALSWTPAEAELLLPRNTPMRIISVADPDRNGVTVVRARIEGQDASAAVATAPGGARLAALDRAEQLLERNKQLQARIAELYTEPQSDKLKAIASAKEALARAPQRGLLQEAATPYAVAAVAGLLPGGPLGAAAAIAAPRVVRKMGDWIFGRLQRASAESIARTERALDAIVSGTKKTARRAPPIATKVLMAASFAPPETDRRGDPLPAPKTLVGAYKAREREILSQVESGPNGKPVMTMAARRQLGDRLAGVTAVAPALADKLEAAMARVVEYLADKLPKRPDMGAMQLGPDHWQPSDIQMRTFARVVSAVRDPGGVEERLASGMLTPEEAEAYRDVWPERFADVRRKLIEMLPAMRGRIPFERRLALTIFTGVPLDPSLSPPLIRTMQSMYELEPGTEAGTQPPVAQPAFGSMSKEQPTPAQRRAGE
jgi:hypothetical protein